MSQGSHLCPYSRDSAETNEVCLVYRSSPILGVRHDDSPPTRSKVLSPPRFPSLPVLMHCSSPCSPWSSSLSPYRHLPFSASSSALCLLSLSRCPNHCSILSVALSCILQATSPRESCNFSVNFKSLFGMWPQPPSLQNWDSIPKWQETLVHVHSLFEVLYSSTCLLGTVTVSHVHHAKLCRLNDLSFRFVLMFGVQGDKGVEVAVVCSGWCLDGRMYSTLVNTSWSQWRSQESLHTSIPLASSQMSIIHFSLVDWSLNRKINIL